MSKKLKKRIRELCGLDALSKEARVELCCKLINDVQFKHSLCNKVLGLTFKDIDKVLNDEMDNKKPLTHEQKVFKVLNEQVPEKIDPAFEPGVVRTLSAIHTEYFSMEDCNRLLNAPEISDKENENKLDFDNSTYTLEEAAALVVGTYDPRNFPKRPYRSEE